MVGRLLVVLTFIEIVSLPSYSQSISTEKYPQVEFVKVGENTADTIQFSATIKSIYECPPCPAGAQCKPCIGDHVLVTNGNSAFDFRVFTRQLSLFEVDGVYDLLVRFRSKLHRKDNIELVRAKRKK